MSHLSTAKHTEDTMMRIHPYVGVGAETGSFFEIAAFAIAASLYMSQTINALHLQFSAYLYNHT